MCTHILGLVQTPSAEMETTFQSKIHYRVINNLDYSSSCPVNSLRDLSFVTVSYGENAFRGCRGFFCNCRKRSTLSTEKDRELEMGAQGEDRRRRKEEREQWGDENDFLYPAFLPLIGVPPGEVIWMQIRLEITISIKRRLRKGRQTQRKTRMPGVQRK